ncbi:MAG TPA: c-type cytochrome [Longimicrobiales bacterium]|nr:c-type cytochrome [Longimicrobiales bacterium]
MRTFLKWAAYILGAIVVLLTIAGVVAFTVSNGKLNATHDVAANAIPIPSDSASLDRGRHFNTIMGCTECHGEDFGGRILIDAAPFVVLYSPNLTTGEGGAGNRYDDAGFARAIRHGIGDDDRSLLIMPSPEYNHLSDADVGAMIAWIRRAPPVHNLTPEPSFGPIGRLLVATDQAPGLIVATSIDHDAPRPPAPPAGPTVEYGQYLARVCAGCHTQNYAGTSTDGPDGSPPVLNITPAGRLGHWSNDEFRTAMRTGVTPNGYALKAQFMPWPFIGQATDVELDAMYLYLRSLPSAFPE